jgi:hypothetical protein
MFYFNFKFTFNKTFLPYISLYFKVFNLYRESKYSLFTGSFYNIYYVFM